ncbi:MAG: hypothetical protein LC101_05315 [Flavobacteriales bacterium]|nr:hypothetical protein [Flavobacteriales bacterium]
MSAPIRYIIILLLILISGGISAQPLSPDSIAEAYKQRLYMYFVYPDTVAGGSIPAARVWPQLYCDDAWLMQRLCNGNGIVLGQTGIMEWMDATIHLAYYMAWLSTDYYIEYKAGRNVDKQRKELSYAMFALKRLDYAADLKYYLKPKLDGFLLRDDVPLSFASHFDKMHCVKSGPVCRPLIEDGNMMSQDQVIYLLWAHSLSMKLLPDSATSAIESSTFHQLIKEQTHRMVTSFSRNDWILTDPYGSRVPLGYSALGYSYAIARVAKLITGKYYQNWASLTTGLSTWNLLMSLDYDTKNPTQTEVNIGMQLALSNIIGAPDYQRFQQWCRGKGMEIYILSDALFRKRDLDEWEPVFREMLSDAPIHGPCHLTPGCTNTPGWSSENRWFHPDNRNGAWDQKGAMYNGLDYLLLYNLYRIHFSQ